MRNLLRSCLVGALWTGASGCTTRVQPISVTVLTKACRFSDGTASPTPSDGVDHYKVRVSGPDFAPIEQTFAAGSPATLSAIPAGTGRVITVLGYHGAPSGSGSTVEATGTSAPFEVPAAVDAANPIAVAVVLRSTGKFSGAAQASAPATCAELKVPRAGHAATLLADGRVLFTGGYSIPASATTLLTQAKELNWDFHTEAEIFDPTTGSVTTVSPMSSGLATTSRAFHTSSLLPNGQVLIAGGETVPDQTTRAVFTQHTAAIYDPGGDFWTFPPMTPESWRSRHAAVTDGAGRVLLVGGVIFDSSSNGDPAQPTGVAGPPVWYDPTAASFTQALNASSDRTLATFGAASVSAAPWVGGQYLVTAGGVDLDGTFPSLSVGFFTFNATRKSYDLVSTGDFANGSLNPRRFAAAAATLGPNGDHVLFAGGYTDLDAGTANSHVETLYLDYARADGGPVPPAVVGTDPLRSARGDVCAAALADGRVLTAGGDIGGATSDDAELYALNGSGVVKQTGSATLFNSRKFHTCTPLKDGSVLVAGGVSLGPSGYKVLGSLEIYTPVPLQ